MRMHDETARLERCRSAFRQVTILKNSTTQDDLFHARMGSDFKNPIHEAVVKSSCNQRRGKSGPDVGHNIQNQGTPIPIA